MYQRLHMLIWLALITALIILQASANVFAQDDSRSTALSEGLQQRIDFGSAHILGQSIKSGAVYLMHRKKSDIKSMLEVRKNYRSEIIEDFALEKTAIAGMPAENGNRLTPQD
jgi:hypothetical protein